MNEGEILTAIITGVTTAILGFFKKQSEIKKLRRKELLLTEEERDKIIEELPRDTLKKESPDMDNLTMTDHRL